MDTSYPNKRLFDHSAVDRLDPHLTPSSSVRRRQHHHYNHPPPSSPATPQSHLNNPFRTPLKLSAGETLFRILCPASKTGGLIGKGGAIIRQVREETGAKIRIDESTPGAEDRVIYIAASDSNPNPKNKETNSSNSSVNNNSSCVTNDGDSKNNDGGECDGKESGSGDGEETIAQKALVRVFERIVKVDEERNKTSKDENGDENVAEGGGGVPQGPVLCRLLVAGNQIGSVLGRGGKIIEKIRQESGAQVRVLPKDQIPDCASAGDEMIQMAGKYLSVRKALVSVSNCLQEAGNNRPMGTAPHGHGYGPDHHHRTGMEEEVVFRLLCHVDKVGSLIGKGGSIRRAMQTETGASIKISDSPAEPDERVVVISSLETLDQRHSPAQDAVMRVNGRMAEIGFEPGAPVVSRLLVHSRQIGCLWGKGGSIVAEMRRVTGANIQIFPSEQVAKYGMPNDEVVQVIGSLPCVQDAMFRITGRLRETVFPVRSYHPSGYMGPYPDMPPPSFRPRHDPASPVGHFEPPPFLHGVDHHRPPYSYPYGNERPGYGPITPPGRHTSQSGSNRYHGEFPEYEGGLSKANDPAGRNEASGTGHSTVEITIPPNLLGYLYGENKSNIGHIRQISGANVMVQEESSRVVLSGTADEIHSAQCLVHGFILCEQHLTQAGA
ncbi:RNA-binding KH domain-containing protein RCF3 [Rutidosis leptorrhynchoides]|uniref:RNA-binding KH domain-containing protein RCF3 n=1 Tax=Rutidosis leptorrhynchoides TaxID=125765 RepID=UPI003A994311